MANKCLNHLIVYGQAKEIQQFFEDCREDKTKEKSFDFSFASLVPLSSEDNRDRRKAWGTEVDADVQFLCVTSNDGTITFETTWKPPVTWMAKVTYLYPHLQFVLSFHEWGNQLAGYVEGKNGTINYQECMDRSEYVHFVYSGEPEHSFQFDRSCIDCGKVEVSVEDIIKHKDVLCTDCQTRKLHEGGFAS